MFKNKVQNKNFKLTARPRPLDDPVTSATLLLFNILRRINNEVQILC